MDYQPEPYTPAEPSRIAPPALRRPPHRRTTSREEVDDRRRDEEPASWRAARPNTLLLAVEHLAIARQMTTFLWILSAALMYQSAALGANGRGYSVAGLIVIASAMVLGFVSHRRLHATIAKWYERDGLSRDEAHQQASRDVEQAHSGKGLHRSDLDIRTVGARLDGHDR